jgi:anthranilate phosphoribosyltransferase
LRSRLQVVGGRGHEACGDAACLNAAAVLYVSGQAVDLYDGLGQARAAVVSGAALRKLEEWVAVQAGGVAQRQAGEARLGALLERAGLSN